jgi:hypothetical protein
MKTLLKNTVQKFRFVLYVPVNFLASTSLPLPFFLAFSSVTVKVDAPLRRYLLGGHHAI